MVEHDPLAWIELDANCPLAIQPFLTVDSWVAMRISRTSIVDINDCSMCEPDDLALVRDHVGGVDVPIPQFGPAAWLRNPEDSDCRAAGSRLQQARRAAQIEALRPTRVIPSGSLVWFAHQGHSGRAAPG
jgi:hypothetical protein